MLRPWKSRVTSRVSNKSTFMDSLPYADGIVIIKQNEDDLHRSMFQLQEAERENSLTISERKTKTVAFKDKHPARTKIVITNITLNN